MSDPERAVLSQHQELDFESDRLRMLAENASCSLDANRARQILERETRTLIDKLRSHFRYEEKGGYMKGVVSEKPHLAAEVDRLRADHDVMRSEMAELEATSFEDGSPEDFRRAIVAFLDRVRDHEQAENGVLERFITEEYGR